ncbi:MAG: hypothetical protein ACTSUK_02280 [Promethearchaeota archaeon]
MFLRFHKLSFDYVESGSSIYLGNKKKYLIPYTFKSTYTPFNHYFISGISPILSYRRPNTPNAIITKHKIEHKVEYHGGLSVTEIAQSGKEDEITGYIQGKDSDGNYIPIGDSAVASMYLPEPQWAVYADNEKIINYRFRSDSAYDRIRFLQRLPAIKKLLSNYYTKKNWYYGKREIGYRTDEEWEDIVSQFANSKIELSYEIGRGVSTEQELTLRELDDMLKSRDKAITYDWLISLKNKAGHLTSLLGIEYLGTTHISYMSKKDLDAAQLKEDGMSMIYIVIGPAEKQKFLDHCSVIGKAFPILTETEFYYMMIGLHNAYNDWGPTNMEFTLENFLKRLMMIDDGKTQPNWQRWKIGGMKYAANIQGSFGITTSTYGACEMGNFYGNDYFIWEGGHSPRKIKDYTWGNQLYDNFWAYSRSNLPSPAQQISSPRKVFAQFGTWLWSIMSLHYWGDGDYYTISYDAAPASS